ncbi:MAG: hypothetical protein IKV98_08775 [Clostridia bacterium]|nr:hypothetical protein [Clostridia bacterium]
MFYLITEIFICFFAAVGMCFFVLALFDCYTAGKAGIKATLVISEIADPENAEYSLRVLEGHLSHTALGKYITQIIAAYPNADVELIEKLDREFGNLKKEESPNWNTQNLKQNSKQSAER